MKKGKEIIRGIKPQSRALDKQPKIACSAAELRGIKLSQRRNDGKCEQALIFKITSGINILLVVVGTISLGGGIVGIVFPLIPTVPFFLLTLSCYAKSSSRFERWFSSTRIYKKFLRPFITTRSMTNWGKLRVLLLVTVIILISIILVNYLWLRIMLTAIILGHWIYFLGFVPSVTKTELCRKLAEAEDKRNN